MAPLICHLVGDYLLQSDWMAQEKRRSSVAAGAHALAYTLPFLVLTWSVPALAVIAGTHFLIDRFGLARYVVWAKNFLGPRRVLRARAHFLEFVEARHWPWGFCQPTGYGPDKPDFLAVWLLIVADNTLHLICNDLALRGL